MKTYVVGDVHGCVKELDALLEQMEVRNEDQVWFLGDLVGRGPHEQDVIERVLGMENSAIILGNHDLHFLAQRLGSEAKIDSSNDQKALYNQWIKRGKMVLWHEQTDTLCVHAGIWPAWSKDEVMQYAYEIEQQLSQEKTRQTLWDNMYGDDPCQWDAAYEAPIRYRVLINIFTRMRAMNKNGRIDLAYKNGLQLMPEDLVPWYQGIKSPPFTKVVFGHWASLQGHTGRKDMINLDGGLVHGGILLGLCLESGQIFNQKKVL